MSAAAFPKSVRLVQAIDRLYPWLFGVALASQPFLENFWPSFEGTKAAYRGSLALVGLVYVFQGFAIEAALWRWKNWTRWLSPLAYGARIAAVFCPAAWILARLASRWSNLGDIPAMALLERDFYWTPLFIVSAILARRSNFGRLAEGKWAWGMSALRFFAYCLFFWGLLSALASKNPLESLKDFRNDLGGALATFLIMLDALRRLPDARRLLAVALATSAYVVAINFLGLARFAWGSEGERLYWMVGAEIIYSDEYYFVPEIVRSQMTSGFDYRPMFPFGHHNRLSNYAMMLSAIALALLAWPGARRKERAWAGLGFAASFALMNLTLGRGAWLSFGAGMAGALALLFDWRRASHWVAALCLAALMIGAFEALPARQKQRFAEIYARLAGSGEASGQAPPVSAGSPPAPEAPPVASPEAAPEQAPPAPAAAPETSPVPEGPPSPGQILVGAMAPVPSETSPGPGHGGPGQSNMDRRLIAFKTARAAIQEHPLVGLGYGYHNYAMAARAYRPGEGAADETEAELYQSHAHNNLLQVAAEMGLPALAAYLGFHLTLFVLLTAAARRARRNGWPSRWALACGLALFLMAHCYGMTNYSLRYTLGDFFWMTMALLAVMAARASDGSEGGLPPGEARP